MSIARPSARPLLPALAGIRFFAAIHVCLHHLAQMTFAISHYPTPDSAHLEEWANGTWDMFDQNWMIRSLLRGALVQVGMFFVMSGFILTYSHPVRTDGTLDRRSYFLARACRVYAMYFIGLFVTLPIFLFFISQPPKADDPSATQVAVVSAAEDPPLGDTGSGTARSKRPPEPVYSTTEKVVAGITIPLLMHAWFPRLSIFPWNPPAWSLSVEAFAYLCFPFLIVWMVRWNTRRLVFFGCCCYVFALIPPLWYILTDPDGYGGVDWNMNLFWFNFVRHNPLFRAQEFFIGMVVGRFVAERAAENARTGRTTGGHLSFWAVVAIILFLMFSESLLGPTASYLLLHNGLLAPVFAIGVAGLALGGGPVGWICSLRPVVAMGEAAYAIYLLHFPFLAYSLVVFKDAHDKGEPMPTPWNYMVTFLVSVTILSVLTNRYLEVPLRRLIRWVLTLLWPAKPKPAAKEA